MTKTEVIPAPTLKVKRKLSFDEMIQHLEDKNIQFNLISKEKASYILEHSSYMYKLTAYRKNFEQNGEGRYINLEFGMLYDLATIDIRLRYLVLQMCLDIEHSVKTKILADITNDPTEDGYSIVKEFLHHDNSCITDYMGILSRKSHYNHGIYTKHSVNTPVWVFFEVISFGTLVKFVEFYHNYHGAPRKYSDLYAVLRYAKNIRNLAAHNSPILIDIVAINQVKKTSKPITSFVRRIPTITKNSQQKRLSNRKIHDLTALFYVHNKYINSDSMKQARYKDLKALSERCLKYKEYYTRHQNLVAIYKYFQKIVDFLTNDV